MWKFYIPVFVIVLCSISCNGDFNRVAENERNPRFSADGHPNGLDLGNILENKDLPLPLRVVINKVDIVLKNVIKMKANLKNTRLVVSQEPNLDNDELANFQKAVTYLSDHMDFNELEERLILLTQSEELLMDKPEEVLAELQGYEDTLEAFNLQCQKIMLKATARNLVKGIDKKADRNSRGKRDTNAVGEMGEKKDMALQLFMIVTTQMDSVSKAIAEFPTEITHATGAYPKDIEAEVKGLHNLYKEEVLSRYNFYKMNQHCTDAADINTMTNVMGSIQHRLKEIIRQVTDTTPKPEPTTVTKGGDDPHAIASMIEGIKERTKIAKLKVAGLKEKVDEVQSQGKINSEQARMFHKRTNDVEQFLTKDVEMYIFRLAMMNGNYPFGTLERLKRLEADFDESDKEFIVIVKDLKIGVLTGIVEDSSQIQEPRVKEVIDNNPKTINLPAPTKAPADDPSVVVSMLNKIESKASISQQFAPLLKEKLHGFRDQGVVTSKQVHNFSTRLDKYEVIFADIVAQLYEVARIKGDYPVGTIEKLRKLEEHFEEKDKEFKVVAHEIKAAITPSVSQKQQPKVEIPKVQLEAEGDVANVISRIKHKAGPVQNVVIVLQRNLNMIAAQGNLTPEQTRAFSSRLDSLNHFFVKDIQEDLQKLVLHTGGHPIGTLAKLSKLEATLEHKEKESKEVVRELETAMASVRGKREVRDEQVDKAVEIFNGVNHRVSAASGSIDQVVSLLSQVFQKTGVMPQSAASQVDTLQERLKQEVFPKFSYFKVNQHCTKPGDIQTMTDVLTDLERNLAILKVKLQQELQRPDTTVPLPTEATIPPPLPALGRIHEDRADHHIIAGIVKMIRTRVEPIRQGLARLHGKIEEFLREKVISTEEAQIFYHRVANLEKFISTDILARLAQYESRKRYSEGALEELKLMESNLDDIEVEYDSITSDTEKSADRGVQGLELEGPVKKKGRSRTIKKRSVDLPDSEDEEETDEGPLMAQAKLIVHDVEDSIDAVKEGDPHKVKRNGVIAAIASIFIILTIGIFMTAIIYHCKYEKKKKAVDADCDEVPLVESGSRRSQRSYRSRSNMSQRGAL